MSRAVWLGVDIGLDGGLARIVASPAGGIVCIEADRMPCLTEAKGRKAVDPRALARWLIKASVGAQQVMVVYEQVHAMPKQGVSSVFSFGRSRGVTEGVIAALELPSLAVPPSRWKRDMGVTADKQATRAVASRLMPMASGQWALKRDDGLAEAALLALWVMQRQGIPVAE